MSVSLVTATHPNNCLIKQAIVNILRWPWWNTSKFGYATPLSGLRDCHVITRLQTHQCLAKSFIKYRELGNIMNCQQIYYLLSYYLENYYLHWLNTSFSISNLFFYNLLQFFSLNDLVIIVRLFY